MLIYTTNLALEVFRNSVRQAESLCTRKFIPSGNQEGGYSFPGRMTRKRVLCISV